MRLVVPLWCAFTFGQGVAAQTAVLCTAEEQWTIIEDVGRPANLAFNITFDFQGRRLSEFRVGGLNCETLFGVYVGENDIQFTCGMGATEFAVGISRLSGEFFMFRTYREAPHLDGMTIGSCERGNKRF